MMLAGSISGPMLHVPLVGGMANDMPAVAGSSFPGVANAGFPIEDVASAGLSLGLGLHGVAGASARAMQPVLAQSPMN